jgi:hypothetical protein
MLERAEVDRWRRLTAAMIRTAGKEDPEALAQVLDVLAQVPDLLVDAVSELRGYPVDRPNSAYLDAYSWADIAAALGVSRQAAQKRFTRKACVNA